ncbi:hypothetical protein BDV38DRAFT_210321 [Aspergillus pseudotamarii]|uniref:Uncharacterized protein n=1 Tax=Aspergillus pseudotamarii TaxID=132259 RepID=A0A5N6SFM1_ASPPS|nr:uncharacterized protein BDV38DRAFT_210321 [Aspergillus pseudotamarii]KAE8132481.1 hypothetical protein BDV38DRAFT_210321 [Aspergillus pseudotamarii]
MSLPLTPGFFLDAGHWIEFQFNSLTGLSSYARHDLMAFYFWIEGLLLSLIISVQLVIRIDTSMLV